MRKNAGGWDHEWLLSNKFLVKLSLIYSFYIRKLGLQQSVLRYCIPCNITTQKKNLKWLLFWTVLNANPFANIFFKIYCFNMVIFLMYLQSCKFTQCLLTFLFCPTVLPYIPSSVKQNDLFQLTCCRGSINEVIVLSAASIHCLQVNFYQVLYCDRHCDWLQSFLKFPPPINKLGQNVMLSNLFRLIEAWYLRQQRNHWRWESCASIFPTPSPERHAWACLAMPCPKILLCSSLNLHLLAPSPTDLVVNSAEMSSSLLIEKEESLFFLNLRYIKFRP